MKYIGYDLFDVILKILVSKEGRIKAELEDKRTGETLEKDLVNSREIKNCILSEIREHQPAKFNKNYYSIIAGVERDIQSLGL